MQEPKELIEHTLWVVPWNKEYVAVDHTGTIIKRHKHKATLIYILRSKYAPSGDTIWAIADVVAPSSRQPNRKLPKSKHQRAQTWNTSTTQ